jgi:hypothetical protein
MIRDPSDGSVREKPDVGIPISTGISPAMPAPVPGIPSGLPITTDPREIDRLNRSRDWLKTYKGEK